MQHRRTTLPLLVVAASILVGVGLSGHGQAFYLDPRFYPSQPPITNRVVRNAYGYSPSEEYIITNPSGTRIQFVAYTAAAVTNWNDALRSPPNSITKYPLHYNSVGDPVANVIVNFVSDQDVALRCSSNTADACNDQIYPTTNIWVKTSRASNALVTHEIGHSLWYDDQYYSNLTCSPADTIMNITGAACHNSITTTDVNDFQTHYEPTYQSPDATSPDTWNSNWVSVYNAGDVRLNYPSSLVEWNYYWQQFTDTNGSQTGSGYLSQNTTFRTFSYNLGSRYCTTAKIYNEVGYPGTRSWSPRSQFSCIGATQVQNAGFLLSTSDRSSPSSSTLYVRIKNFTGGSRNVGIFGYPSLNDIGCGYQTLNYLATRECYVNLARGAYDRLAWYAWNGSVLSWGYLDFE